MMNDDLKSFYADKKVFVTGASGFIGSHLVSRLIAMDAQVVAFLSYNSRADIGHLNGISKDTPENIQIVFGDVRESDSVSRAISDCEIVLHLASLISIPYSYVRPQEVIDTNVSGTFNTLLAAHKAGISRFVQTSSSEVYGSAITVPIDEKHPKQPQSIYSASKISADAIAMGFYYSYEMAVAICRPFNTYGPRQSDRAVIPTIIAQALNNQEIKLGNTDTTRDFTYVLDTVDGILSIGASDAAIGQELNLGTGSEISIGDLVEKISQLLDKEIFIVLDEQRVRPSSSEVTRLLSSNKKVQEITGWSPKISLDEGLANTVSWIKERPENYAPDLYRI